MHLGSRVVGLLGEPMTVIFRGQEREKNHKIMWQREYIMHTMSRVRLQIPGWVLFVRKLSPTLSAPTRARFYGQRGYMVIQTERKQV